MKAKKIGALLALVIVLVSSCSKDPYENSGSCNSPGNSKIISSKLAICTGLSNSKKWYHSGKYYDDAVLLAKIFYRNYSDEDISESTFKEQGVSLDSLYTLYPKGLISVDDLANYAENDARWDALIESKATYDAAEKQGSYLMQERFRLRADWERGKATRQEAYLAQEAQINYLNGEYSRAQEDFDTKLEVLRATLASQYELFDRNILLIFLIRHFESQK